jgi:FMN phosphatase YigB (HAD superfamily)
MLKVENESGPIGRTSSEGYFPVPATLKGDLHLRRTGMQVLLDLYGVLLDHEKTFRGYRDRLADLLAARFGGDPEAWRHAHDEAFVAYTRRAHDADWDARRYGDVVDELDERHLIDMFARMGKHPEVGDPLLLSRELEREALAGVNGRFPDARSAIERLRARGHRVYVATGGSETNDAALRGAGLSDLVDGIFSGHSQKAHKSRPAYWADVPRSVGARPTDCVLVDDRLDYLEAAASVGIVALLLDRKGAHRPEAMPPYVAATLRNLAGLPHWVDTWTSTPRS